MKNLRKIILIVFIFTANNFSKAQVNEQQSTNSSLLNIFTPKSSAVNYNAMFNEVVEFIKRSYVEEVSDKKIYEAAMEGMLSSLDPHSSYLNENDFQDLNIVTRGEFGGVGMEVIMEKGFVKVITPYEDAPAFKAGIKSGDFITSIEGHIVKGLSLAQAVEKLRGKPKTKVKITVFRETSNESIDFTITREIVKIIPVKAKIIASDVALIKINSFSENTADLVRKEFLRLNTSSRDINKTQLRGLILDLRWNAGGLLDQSKDVAELFLEDALIVSIKGRIPSANEIYRSNGHDITEGIPMVVLINGGSASASEIVAGALQDNKRALIVGTKSFGKGSAQDLIPLPPDKKTAIKLTTARFYTPSGRSIQALGIEPDVFVEEAIVTPIKGPKIGDESSLMNHLEQEQDLNMKVKQKQKISLPSLSDKENEDFQLLRAIDIVKGMALYSERLSN